MASTGAPLFVVGRFGLVRICRNWLTYSRDVDCELEAFEV